MTDQQLQSLRNMGCEFEEAADEIERLRALLSEYVTLDDKHFPSAALLRVPREAERWR